MQPTLYVTACKERMTQPSKIGTSMSCISLEYSNMELGSFIDFLNNSWYQHHFIIQDDYF